MIDLAETRLFPGTLRFTKDPEDTVEATFGVSAGELRLLVENQNLGRRELWDKV